MVVSVTQSVYLSIGRERGLRQKAEGEPQLLVMVSDNEEEKIEWMVARLREVYSTYNKEMPSVGVFIPNGRSVDRFVKRLAEEDDLGEIRFLPLSGRYLQW